MTWDAGKLHPPAHLKVGERNLRGGGAVGTVDGAASALAPQQRQLSPQPQKSGAAREAVPLTPAFWL